MTTNPPHMREPMRTFELNGVPYIPSYLDDSVFIAPGNRTCTRQELVVSGARITFHHLWPRAPYTIPESIG